MHIPRSQRLKEQMFDMITFGLTMSVLPNIARVVCHVFELSKSHE